MISPARAFASFSPTARQFGRSVGAGCDPSRLERSQQAGRIFRPDAHYTSLRAQDLRRSGDIGSYGHNVRRIATRFWKCYIGRRGYKEGPWGFLIALCAALYPILSYLKARLESE